MEDKFKEETTEYVSQDSSQLLLAPSVSAIMSLAQRSLKPSSPLSAILPPKPTTTSILQKLSPNNKSAGKSIKNGLQEEVPEDLESPFDNVLRTDDFSRAKTMVSIGNFLQTYPPRLTLLKYIKGKSGDEG